MFGPLVEKERERERENCFSSHEMTEKSKTKKLVHTYMQLISHPKLSYANANCQCHHHHHHCNRYAMGAILGLGTGPLSYVPYVLHIAELMVFAGQSLKLVVGNIFWYISFSSLLILIVLKKTWMNSDQASWPLG